MKFKYITQYDLFTCSPFHQNINLWNYKNCIIIDLENEYNKQAILNADPEFMMVLAKYLCEEKEEHESEMYFDTFDHYVLQGHSLRTIVNYSNEKELTLMEKHSNITLNNKYASVKNKSQASLCIQEIDSFRKKDINKLKIEKRRSSFSKIRNQVMLAIIDRDGYKCQICKIDKNLTVDHIYPLSKGGSDELDNLQLLCRPCNSRKNDK